MFKQSLSIFFATTVHIHKGMIIKTNKTLKLASKYSPDHLLVTRKLFDMIDHPLDDLSVSLPESGHQTRHFPVIL